MKNKCTTCGKNNSELPFEYSMIGLGMFEDGGDWIQNAIKHPGRCTPGSPNYDCPKGSPQWNLAQRFKHGDLHKGANGGEMIKRADGSYSRRGLWDNIRANKGSGKKPTKEMLKQERKIKSKQMGGDAQSQIVEIIKAYAKKYNVQPQVIVEQLQQLEESEQEQALQSMVQELQQGSDNYDYANDYSQMEEPQYQYGGNYENYYRTTGGYGTQGAVGLGENIPYIAPAVGTAFGDSKMFGPLKALTGYMGLASGIAGSALGYGKTAQWLGNKIKPGSNILQDTNNTLKNVVDFGVNAGYYRPTREKQIIEEPVSLIDKEAINNADFTKMPVYNDNPKYKDTMIAQYGGDLIHAQFGIPDIFNYLNDPRFGQSANYSDTLSYDIPKKQNNDSEDVVTISNRELNNKNGRYDGYAFPEYAPKNNKQYNDNSDFSGMEYAQKAITGLGTFNNYLNWKENNRRKREYENMLKRVGNTDFRLSSNNPNPFGNYTLNVGPANNFQLGMTTPIQDFGTTAKFGGEYQEGGEYQVSEEELLQLMQNGAEIEFIN